MKKNVLLLASALLAIVGSAQTNNPAPYCASVFDNNYNMIQSVGVNGTTFNTGAVGSWGAQNSYTFFNNATFPSLALNGSATLAISFYSVSDWEPRYFGVWIDYNNNATFDASELLMNNANTTFTDLPTGGGAPAQTVSMAITIPGTAVAGSRRMRVVRSQAPVGSPYAAYSPTVQVLACNPLSANQAYGCTYDFTVNLLGGNPVANFSVSPNIICAGSTVSLTDQSTNAPSTWTWTSPGATNIFTTTQNPILLYPTAGIYTIGLIASNGAGPSALITKTISVQALPQLTVSPTSLSICAKKTSSLIASGASTYSWSTGATSGTLSISPTVTTVYTVLGNLNGCASSLSRTVTVSACLGVAEADEANNSLISIYPNPASTLLQLKMQEPAELVVRIYNSLGATVYEQLHTDSAQLDLSTFSSGVYYIELQSKSLPTRTLKLMVQ